MQLTEHMVLARSKQCDLNTIKRINLWGCELTDISIVSLMTSVEVLALSVNNLSCLKPLESCTKLQELYLRKNNVSDFNQLLHLQNLSSLTHLCLAENPCSIKAGATYRANVVRMLPNLKKLDEEIITSEDIESAIKLDCLQNGTESFEKNISEEEKVSTETSELAQSNDSMQSNTPEQLHNTNPMEQQSQLSLNNSVQSSDESQDLILIGPSSIDDNMPQSPNKSFPLENSIVSEHIVEYSPANSTFPLSLVSTPNRYQALEKEFIFINGIPQWNIVVQIHQSQPRMEIPLEIPHSTHISIQTFAEPSSCNEEQRSPQSNYDNARDTNYDLIDFKENSPKFTRTSFHEHHAENKFQNNISRQSKENQNISGLKNVTQKARSRYLSKANSQQCWKDDLQRNRTRTHSSYTLTRSPNTKRRNANLLSGLLCVVQSLDMESLQVLNHSILCRMNELSIE